MMKSKTQNSINRRLAIGAGLSAVVLGICVLIASENFPSAEAQFGFGLNRFFRNFQRGAQRVVSPMFRPVTAVRDAMTVRRPQPTFSSRPTFSSPQSPQSDGFVRQVASSGPSSGGQSSNSGPFSGAGGGFSSATDKPQESANDEALPTDCGRDPEKGNGLLCFPVGKLCAERVNKPGIQRFGNKNYWFSWQDPALANQKWDWFNARNYCRKRCMDLVSFESKQEYEWVKGFMSGVKYIWTSGRLCNFDGCDRRDFEPKKINGWFWSANQARLSPSNSQTQFHDWSQTGGFRPPRPQPDNREQEQQNGGEEACLAVLNNFYGDGIKWHDVACHHEKPIVCEDVEGHLQFARRTFPNIQIP